MISELDAQALALSDPSGTTLVSTGTVVAVDPAGGTVTVAIRGDTAAVVTLPATAARYRLGGSCRVQHNVADRGRAVLVAGAVDPLAPMVLGTVSAVNTGALRATVSVLGQSAVIPYTNGTYGLGNRVWVALDDWGVPLLLVAASAEATPTEPPVPPDVGGGGTVQATVQISPQWSGSWRSIRGAWDRWNTNRYGGRSTLYQGNGESSGPMVGLATYGDQLANLGATSIDLIRVRLRPVGLSGASGPATVQGSPHGAQPGGAPALSGDTATEGNGGVPQGADLSPATREGFRTGALKGLALVGANYWAVAGAGNGDGMVLDVVFTRPA